MEITKTGIKGFDKLVGGGFPKGSTILLSGTPGTGKTIFALEYLYNGTLKFNEKSLFVTFEERKENLINQASQFGWDLEALEKKGLLNIMEIYSSDINKYTVKSIIDSVNKLEIKRVVIDSLSTLSINTPTIYEDLNKLGESFAIKKFIYNFIDQLRSLKGITTILISQTIDENQLSRDTVSDFICDGIINLVYATMGGEFSRSLLVRKMRRVKNDEDIHPLEIGNKGLVVHSLK